MTTTLTRRTGFVLATALALFAWAALLSTSAWSGAPATAAAQEEDLPDAADEDEDDGLGGLDGLAPGGDEDDDATEGDDAVGDGGFEDDGLEDDAFDDGLEDDGLEDDGAEDATPVGGVDAGFGGLAGDGANTTAIAIAVITVLLAAAGGLWVQTRRSASDPA